MKTYQPCTRRAVPSAAPSSSAAERLPACRPLPLLQPPPPLTCTATRSLRICRINNKTPLCVCLCVCESAPRARPENSERIPLAWVHAISLDLSGPRHCENSESNAICNSAMHNLRLSSLSSSSPSSMCPFSACGRGRSRARWHSDFVFHSGQPGARCRGRLCSSLYGAVLVVIARPNASGVCVFVHTLGSYFKATCFLHCSCLQSCLGTTTRGWAVCVCVFHSHLMRNSCAYIPSGNIRMYLCRSNAQLAHLNIDSADADVDARHQPLRRRHRVATVIVPT